MEDCQIIALYWARAEQAISETADKYGRYCRSIAMNILADVSDAEETINDTWLGAWNSIPPHRPDVLSAFLGKLTRRIALNRWRARRRNKRGGGEAALALSELEECIPASHSVEDAVEEKELIAVLDDFVAALPELERRIFLRRYWYLDPIGKISADFGFSGSKVKSMLHRTRAKLRTHLTQRGY